MWEAAHYFLGRLEKYALAFSEGQVESSNDTEDEFFWGEAKFTTGDGGERWVLGFKQLGIDTSVDDVDLCGIDPAGGAMVSFRNW